MKNSNIGRQPFLLQNENRRGFVEIPPFEETLPKALRTQASTALTNKFGLVGLVCLVLWVWFGGFS